jgi:hypothetical protein
MHKSKYEITIIIPSIYYERRPVSFLFSYGWKKWEQAGFTAALIPRRRSDKGMPSPDPSARKTAKRLRCFLSPNKADIAKDRPLCYDLFVYKALSYVYRIIKRNTNDEWKGILFS